MMHYHEVLYPRNFICEIKWRIQKKRIDMEYYKKRTILVAMSEIKTMQNYVC